LRLAYNRSDFTQIYPAKDLTTDYEFNETLYSKPGIELKKVTHKK